MRKFISFLFIFFFLSFFAQQKWTLQQCIEQGIKYNLSILQADVNQQIAKVNYDQSEAAILPSLNAGASHTYNIGRTIDRYCHCFSESNL